MNAQIVCSRPIRAAISAFLGLLGVTVGISVARGMGAIDAALARRSIGFLVGVMVVVIGNLLPKLRPLNSSRGDPAKTSAAERSAGWILVSTGVAFIVLFAFAPLDEARHISSVIGISTFAFVLVSGTWLAQDRLLSGRQSGETVAVNESSLEKRKLTIWLLFAFFYVFATFCAVSVLDDKRWVRELASWMSVAFGTIYGIVYAVLESRHTAKQLVSTKTNLTGRMPSCTD